MPVKRKVLAVRQVKGIKISFDFLVAQRLSPIPLMSWI